MRRHLCWGVVLSVLPFGAMAYLQGMHEGDDPAQAQEPAPLIQSLEGRDLFRAYCAGCHGLDAHSGGPAAAGLKTRPPDLTEIAKRRGGVFPLESVERIIAGEESSSATHGMREMPVWGPILGQIQSDRTFGKVRIRNLAKYLETLQRKR
jgi:mono/diheme cytochrome c family protein